jgi:hypothetical protein
MEEMGCQVVHVVDKGTTWVIHDAKNENYLKEAANTLGTKLGGVL